MKREGSLADFERMEKKTGKSIIFKNMNFEKKFSFLSLSFCVLSFL